MLCDWATCDADEPAEVSNETVGPADGSVRCLFRVFVRKYSSQQMNADERFSVWLVRAYCIEEFRSSLWELVRPHVKRAIEVEQPGKGNGGYVFRWGEPVDPTEDEAPQFVTFCEKKNKKVFTWNHMTNAQTLQRWEDLEIILVIHEYSTALKTKAVYQLALNTFLAAHDMSKPVSNKPAAKKPVAVVSKKPLLPPAADGYSFRDEVRALRETFSQMRSLMTILDSRITLLEQKCDEATIVPVKMDTAEGDEDPLVNFQPKVEMEECDENDD